MVKRMAGFLIMAFSISLTLSVSVTALAGEQSYETEVINNISIGDISIALEEYGADDDGERKDERGIRCVLPGESIKRIVRVTNLANPAWIRIKITYNPDEGMPDLPPSCITVSDDRWLERGGYCYLTSPLGAGEETYLSYTMRIPAAWGNEASGRDFGMEVTAEAVQEANFFPDFAADDPWFGTLIETCVHTSHGLPMALRYGEFSVSFEGGAEGLVHLGDDFFGNLGVLMPGDEGSGTVTLRNAYADPITLYFRTEGIDEGPLANDAYLSISDGKDVIYEGKLSESRDEVQIASLNTQEEKELIYSISIPPECDNSYALTKAADKWIFRASLDIEAEEETEKHTSSGGRTHSGAGSAGPGTVMTNVPDPPADLISIVRDLPQTGENWAVLMAAAVMALSGIILAMILLHRRYKAAEGGAR